MRNLKCEYSVEKGVELILTMDCKSDQEFAINWLTIYNNARENKDAFLNCKLYYNSDIVVLTNVEDAKDVKTWLERFGTVKEQPTKYRLIDMPMDDDYDVEYDVMMN